MEAGNACLVANQSRSVAMLTVRYFSFTGTADLVYDVRYSSTHVTVPSSSMVSALSCSLGTQWAVGIPPHIGSWLHPSRRRALKASQISTEIGSGRAVRCVDCKFEMAPNTTEIVNNTQNDLNMKVGNYQYYVNFAKIGKGAKHTLQVDYSDTYHEFFMGVDGSGKKLVVTSDDCCDYKCIIITEVDGTFAVKREPRKLPRCMEETAPAPKKNFVSSWKFWKF